jgi:hypothetical protein
MCCAGGADLSTLIKNIRDVCTESEWGVKHPAGSLPAAGWAGESCRAADFQRGLTVPKVHVTCGVSTMVWCVVSEATGKRCLDHFKFMVARDNLKEWFWEGNERAERAVAVTGGV